MIEWQYTFVGLGPSIPLSTTEQTKTTKRDMTIEHLSYDILAMFKRLELEHNLFINNERDQDHETLL